MRRYYVYIMASKSRVLYVGITNDIWRRVWEHKNEVNPGFTSKYRVHRLVYFESFQYVGNAIAREKRIKGWLREKKVALIRSTNPTWEDLSEEWFDGKNVRRISFEANNKSRSFASLRMTSLDRVRGKVREHAQILESLRHSALQNPATRLRCRHRDDHAKPPGQAERHQL